MAYSVGEYIEKFLLPQLIHEIQNLKMDFMADIPTAPQRAISKGGIVVHKIGNPIVVDWDKNDDYVDGDIKKFAIENDTIPWQYLSTTPFEVDKEEARESVYDREGILRVKSRDAIMKSWRDKTLHNLAPADDTDPNMPVMRTTGGDRGDGLSKRLTILDVLSYAEKMYRLELIQHGGVSMVLCPEHLTDLQADAINYQDFRDIYVNSKKGEPLDNHGFRFFHNNKTIHYAADNTKKADGAALIGTDRPASVAFYGPYAIKALYNLEVHHDPRSQNTRSNPPISETRFTGNAVAQPTYLYGHGAVISGTV